MILVLNAGSTSLKFKLFSNALHPLQSGEFENTHISSAVFAALTGALQKNRSDAMTNDAAFKVAHRVVHGGALYRDPVKITQTIKKKLKKCSHLAPLHNPHNIKGITLAEKFFKHIPQYAVFDTGFYKTLPTKALLYPLSLELQKKHGFQRFGFHGISHEYALHQAKKEVKKIKLNLISIHLGAGCSITAIKKNKAVDTSMGYTPLEGLMMWSRAGDIDPGIIVNSTISQSKWRYILHEKSGIRGMTGRDNYLEFLQHYANKEKHAQMVMNIFIYRIQKYIGAYFAALGGNLDALVFTGKIGAGVDITRNLVLKDLPFLKKTKLIVVQPNEEWMIAKKVKDLENSSSLCT